MLGTEFRLVSFVALCGLALAGPGCDRGKQPGSKVPVGGDGDGPGDQGDGATADGSGSRRIVAVPQYTPPAVEDWMFSRDGTRIAAETYADECGLWDIASGAYIGDIPLAEDGPCESWLPYDSTMDARTWSADGTMMAEPDGERVITVFEGDDMRKVVDLACQSCTEVLQVAWAPEGKQLAALVDGPLAVEVWNIESRTRERREPLAPVLDLDTLDGTHLGWNEAGIAVVLAGTTLVEDKSYGYGEDYGYEAGYDEGGPGADGDMEPDMVPVLALESHLLPADGGRVVVDPTLFVAEDYYVLEIVEDPLLRTLFLVAENSYDEPRRRMATGLELLAIPVTGAGSGLQWSELSDYSEDSVHIEQFGWWQAEMGTQWVDATSVVSTSYDDYSNAVMSWQLVQIEPTVELAGAQVYDNDSYGDGAAYINFMATLGGQALIDWEACELDEPDPDLALPDPEYADDGCMGQVVNFAGCDPVDGHSPDPTRQMAECEGQLAIVEPAIHPADGRLIRKLHRDPSSEFRWGRNGWLAILDPGGRLTVVDPGTGVPVYEQGDVDAFAEVALGPEQDRLGIRRGGDLELLEGSTGKTLLEVSTDSTLVGLHPDGSRLAAVDGANVVIWSLETGKPVHSVPHGGEVEDVAWRQDGKALLVGVELPERALDAETGEPLGDFGELIDGIGEFTPDPSWRWIHGSDNSFVRTLDGRQIHYSRPTLDGSGWVRLDNGLFEGDVPEAVADSIGVRYRIGGDPLDVPRYSHEQVERWLRHPGLLHDFFVGEALPDAEISEAAFAELTR